MAPSSVKQEEACPLAKEALQDEGRGARIKRQGTKGGRKMSDIEKERKRVREREDKILTFSCLK